MRYIILQYDILKPGGTEDNSIESTYIEKFIHPAETALNSVMDLSEQLNNDRRRGTSYRKLANTHSLSKGVHLMQHRKVGNMERFMKIYSQGKINVVEIWVDTKTGVNYVFHQSGYAGGFTPLLDKEGKPIVTPYMQD